MSLIYFILLLGIIIILAITILNSNIIQTNKENKKYYKSNTSIFFSKDLFLIYFIIACVFFIAYFYYHNYIKVKKEEKFKVFLTFISTIFAVIFSSAMLTSAITFNTSHKNEIITNYNNLSKDFFDDIVDFFIKNPDMNYYYNELFDIQPIGNNATRNFDKEHQISMLIFSKMAKFAIYIQKSTNTESTQLIQDWLGHIFNTFMKSPTLQYYWTNYYKPDFSGPASLEYMKYFYNL